MNILFVTSVYPTADKPYHGIYLEQQAQAMQRLGNHVDILFVVPGAGMEQITQKGLQIYRLGLPFDAIEKLLILPKTKRCLQRFPWEKYDVVSLHMGKLTYMDTITRLCDKANARVVRHFHGLNVWEDYAPPASAMHCAYEKFKLLLKEKLVRRCDAVVGVSDLVCSYVRQKNKTTPVYTVYNGVDLQQFVPVSKKRQAEQFCILCVANLIPLKGQRYLLEAVYKLRNRPLVVKLIGEGIDRDALEKQCRELQIQDRVTFLGTQEYSAVAEHMRNSDMFIMPSYFEAFGCVFIEAMASGVLTCGCKGTGAEEIITDSIDGILLEQKDADSIATAICFAMDNRERAGEIAARGVQRAKKFTWDASAKVLTEVYARVCQK